MGQFRGGMNELMRQAARMQRKIEQCKKEHGDKEITATAIEDKVKATASWAGKLTRVEVDKEVIESEGLDMVLDGIVAASNSALERAQKAMDAELEKITGKVPGMT